ncbi:glutaredoxin-1 [Monosporozyma unispora]|nr:glutaredoxin [Kazachstania unispora]
MKLQYVGVLMLCLMVIFIIYYFLNKDGDDHIIVKEDTLRAIQSLIDKNPILIVSKTHCPYGKQSYITFTHACKVPKDMIKVIQLDEMKYGSELQKGLFQMNGQRTVPHIYINHKFIGGNDDLQDLKNKGKLKALVQEALKE